MDFVPNMFLIHQYILFAENGLIFQLNLGSIGHVIVKDLKFMKNKITKKELCDR